MMKIFFLILSASLLSLHMSAQQAPGIDWQKSLGGTVDDKCFSIKQTSDSGYILGGYSNSYDGDVTGNHGNEDFWIVKMSRTGSLQWQKSFGGSLSDACYAIEQTSDGGYIAAGSTTSNDGDVTGNHGDDDFWVVKLSASGGLEWQKTLGGTGIDVARAVHQTVDGGFIVAGWSSSNDGDVSGHHGALTKMDYWIVKLTSTGTIEWQKSLGGTDDDDLYEIQQTSDGGYFAVGGSYSADGDITGNHGDQDYWVVKLSTLGMIQWQKSLGGSLLDEATSGIQTYDGGYIVTGFTFSNDGNVTGNHGIVDVWITKLSPSGDLQWQKTYGGTSTDEGISVQQLADSGYILGNYTMSNDGDVSDNHGFGDGWITRTTPTGNIVWQKTIGGSGMDAVFYVKKTFDGGFVVAGTSNSTDGDISGNHGGYDYGIAKFMGKTLVPEIGDNHAINIFPNPTSGLISITGAGNASIRVFNIIGNTIKEFAGTDNFSLSGLPVGMYFIQLLNEQGATIYIGKIIKQ